MNKKLYRLKNLIFILCFALVVSKVPENVSAERFIPIDFNCVAKVTGVIDGDSIKVSVWETGETALVKLIGIDAGGDDGAFRYLTQNLMGNIVSLSVDPNIDPVNGIWSNLHVVRNNANISENMLSLGFGRVNTKHKSAKNYNTLVASQNNAQNKKVGIWYEPEKPAVVEQPSVQIASTININTATSSQIYNFLQGISITVAQNIVSYRSSNPINNVSELKFVTGFTKDYFDAFSGQISVSTDISRASYDELLMLSGFTSADANRVINFREVYGITVLGDIVRNSLVPVSRFEANLPYMSLGNVEYIDYNLPNVTLMLNEASPSELMSLGLTSSQASAVVTYKSNYTYKTLSELQRASSSLFYTDFINRYEDNLLLPKYGEYININTAAFTELRDLGLGYMDAESIFQKQGRIYTWLDMPVDASGIDSKITLYTNINAASETELYSLSERMTEEIVKSIIEYRTEQPFGSLTEIRSHFAGLNALSVYNTFSEFVVVR